MNGSSGFCFYCFTNNCIHGGPKTSGLELASLPTKFGMKDAKPIKTTMGTNGHLDLDTRGKSVDQKVYRSMIGSLLYLCASRPDIMLSVCMCARFLDDPKEIHLQVMKKNHEIFSLHSKVWALVP